MASVTGYTAARMKLIEDQAIISGAIVGNDLILTRYIGTTLNAGNVRGPQGIQGPAGPVGEALIDGKAYARKDGLWVPAPPEAPIDGKPYSRIDGAWVLSPGTLLGSSFNQTDSNTSLNTPVAFGSGGTLLTVAVGARGVSVEFGAQLAHSLALKYLYAKLFVDGVEHANGSPFAPTPGVNGHVSLQRNLVFAAGVLTVANHTFEVKAMQSTAEATMSMYESWLTVRSN